MIIPKRLFRRFTAIVAALAFSLLALPYLLPGVWFASLAVNFNLQWIAILVGVALCFMIRKKAFWSGVSLFTALLAALQLLPLYQTAASPPAGAATIDIYLHNVYMLNEEYLDAANAAVASGADVVVLVEIPEKAILPVTARMAEAYPWHASNELTDIRNVHVWSTVPMESSAIIMLSTDPLHQPAVAVKFKDWTLFAVHFDGPISGRKWKIRNDQIASIGAVIAREAAGSGLFSEKSFVTMEARPVVLCGDMNMTSFDPSFRALVKTAGLWDSRNGFGVQATWPTILPPLYMPLDHILVTSDVGVLDRETLDGRGSDHRAVRATLAIPRRVVSEPYYIRMPSASADTGAAR